MSKDTPISKYLASLDRRHSLFAGGRSTCPESPVVSRPTLTRNFDFDDTFYREDQSMLHVPSPKRASYDASSSILGTPSTMERKRKLASLYEDDSEKLQRKIDDLERLLRQTQAELIDSRAVVTKLQHQKSENETAHTVQLINNEKTCKEYKNNFETANEKVQYLEEKLLKFEKKQNETAEDFAQQKSNHQNLVATLQDRVAKLQSSYSDLQEKLHQDSLKSGDAIRKLNTELEGTEKGAEKWIMESQTLKDQLELMQTQYKNCQNELKDAQAVAAKYNELKVKYDEIMLDEQNSQVNQERIKKWENLYVQEQIQNRKLCAEVAKLQASNSVLCTTMSSEMVLREQVQSLEKRVSHMTEELKAKVACDADRTALRHEVKEWKEIAYKLTSTCTNPVQFESFLRQNQNLLLEYKHENSTLILQVENNKRSVERLQGDNSNLREQVKVLKEEKDKLALDLKKTSKRLVLIAQDRDSLKGLKDSYELEFEGQSSESKELQKRNHELETLITEYEQIISDDPAFAKKPCDKCEELSLKIDALSSELESTRRHIEERSMVTSTNLAQLQASEGLSAEASFKILSYGKNPSILSTEERLSELLAENERLKAKIRTYEEESTLHNMDATMKEEKRTLEEKLKNLERKYEILNDAYDYETTQLQIAIGKLFGFHIVLSREPQSQIRLQSVNSPNSQDVFIFQQSDNGDWMLLETPILEVFRQEIEDYLVQAGQIPSFLSIVTIRYAQGIPQQLDETGDSQPHASGNVRTATATHEEQEVEDLEQEEYVEESDQDDFEDNTRGGEDVDEGEEEDEEGSDDDGEEVEEEEEEDYDDDDEEHNVLQQRRNQSDDDDIEIID